MEGREAKEWLGLLEEDRPAKPFFSVFVCVCVCVSCLCVHLGWWRMLGSAMALGDLTAFSAVEEASQSSQGAHMQ